MAPRLAQVITSDCPCQPRYREGLVFGGCVPHMFLATPIPSSKIVRLQVTTRTARFPLPRLLSLPVSPDNKKGSEQNRHFDSPHFRRPLHCSTATAPLLHCSTASTTSLRHRCSIEQRTNERTNERTGRQQATRHEAVMRVTADARTRPTDSDRQ